MGFMTDFTFPPLRAGVLASLVDLKERVDQDPDFLDNSPYDNEAKRVLAVLLAPKVVEKEVRVEVPIAAPARGRGRPTKDVALSDEDQAKVRENIEALLKQLSEMGTGEDEKLETSERIQIVKTKAALNEQLLKMQERVFNVKRMSDFQTIVLGIVESLVPDADKHLFMERIEAYRD